MGNMFYGLKMNVLNDLINMGILFSDNEDLNDIEDEKFLQINIDNINKFIKNNNVELIVNNKINDYKNKNFFIKTKYFIKNKISNLTIKNKTIEDLSNCIIMYYINNNIDDYQNNLIYLFLEDFEITLKDIMKIIQNNS